ncbi:hypothetical protein N7527_009820 [Penicillium freii]|uniref:6-phosphogluconate dehydrogenase NADP-binding domain-containing protein n=1 Tax=Penicillium freii TaxID=48697 RepID=A0A101MGV3_PENFR|nr:hypothetical protein N7527_009820 [Penicillium freii]KUM60346.1 hypothetical protein ACN42_g6785 [Penicillium freii]
MTSSTLRVGWYGLGSMGLGMSLNLQKHLQSNNLSPLRYSNRSLSKGDILRDEGAISEDNFEALVRNSDVIFTMISIDDVLIELFNKALVAGDSLKGKTFVDTSTIHPDTSKWATSRLGEYGAAFIDAPVFGASSVAAAGKLIFAVAGPVGAVETIKPLIMAMGRSIIDMGEDVQKSSLLKISGNVLVISFMEVIAEAQVFAEVTGIDNQQLEEFLGNMFGPVLESYSKRITTGAYAPPLDTSPGFAAALASKDMKHALSIAASHSARLPTLETALNRLTSAREYAGECLDSSAIYGTARMEAGLSFWSETSRQGNCLFALD